MKVRQIMSQRYAVIHPDDTLQQARTVMLTRNVRHLLAIDREDRLAGLVSDRDIREVYPSSLESPDQHQEIIRVPVHQFMSKMVITIHPDDDIEEAALLLYENNIGSLPVIEGEEIVGIVTMKDILYALIELTGLHTHGSTIKVEVPNRPGVLADIAEVFKKHGMCINSVMTSISGPLNRRLNFRVDTINPRQVVREIEEKGYQVVWPPKEGFYEKE
ncbi:MAG: CBS domain-containing protein [Bacillaceae bacterium]|nr:CBS domain-containing protein [Bacillaceae bacterium]